MGLGDGPSWTDEYEWVRLADLPDDRPPKPSALAAAMTAWIVRNPPWPDGTGELVLLVDLDNLRAQPSRWAARMAVVLTLARQADHVALAGQAGPATRARPHLAEFARQVVEVPDGSDLADHVLLDVAAAIPADDARVVVMSNDNIFADLADRWAITVLSPGAEALSDRLRDAAGAVVDLTELEQDVGVR